MEKETKLVKELVDRGLAGTFKVHKISETKTVILFPRTLALSLKALLSGIQESR